MGDELAARVPNGPLTIGYGFHCQQQSHSYNQHSGEAHPQLVLAIRHSVFVSQLDREGNQCTLCSIG